MDGLDVERHSPAWASHPPVRLLSVGSCSVGRSAEIYLQSWARRSRRGVCVSSWRVHWRVGLMSTTRYDECQSYIGRCPIPAVSPHPHPQHGRTDGRTDGRTAILFITSIHLKVIAYRRRPERPDSGGVVAGRRKSMPLGEHVRARCMMGLCECDVISMHRQDHPCGRHCSAGQ